MKKINDQELLNIKGGGIAWGVIGIVASGIVAFVAGILDGIKRPLKCNR